ncbi:terminase large subunit [Microbacterium sp. AG157]|uniref:terminase large subunit n=1 Tax=Microbacterium sp. AG157 TaxID=2183993 RepID=UPI0015F2658F|nr:terminase large subunit [Microbacterium sp. AG157]
METRPRWATPRNPARATIAHEVVNIMALLGWAAMPWQREILETAFEIDPATGLLWYSEIVIIVPRQSGKTSIVLPWGVHRMIMWPDRQYLLYIAQTREKALEKLQEEQHHRIAASPFGQLLQRNRTGNTLNLTNGGEHMKFLNGSKWSIDAPTENAGHGGTLGLTVGDEIFAQKDDRLEAALMPATTAVDDAQSLWISTAGESKTKSPFMWKKAEAGRARVELLRADPSLLNAQRMRTMYVEYSAPDGADPDDPLTWWGCMPALGYTTNQTKIAAFREAMQGGFLRPFLNWWSDDVEKTWKIPKERWEHEAVVDPGSEVARDEVVYVIDVAPESAWASIAVAGIRTDTKIHLEVLADAPGTDWILDGDDGLEVPGIVDLVREAPGPVYLEHRAAGFLLPKLLEAGIDARVMTAANIAVAGPGLLDAVLNHDVVHLGQDELTEALKSASTKATDAGWKWIRGKSMRPVSALVAITYARQMLAELLPDLAYDPIAAFRAANGTTKEAG